MYIEKGIKDREEDLKDRCKDINRNEVSLLKPWRMTSKV